MNILQVPDEFITIVSNAVAFTIVLWIIISAVNNDRGGYS